MNGKIPNPKFQVPKKSQAPNPKRRAANLELGAWCFFGIWDLELGILLHGIL
jgi:hypothetical protein